MATVAIDFDGVIHAYSRGYADGTLYDPPTPGAGEALATLMDRYAVYVHTTRPPIDVEAWFEYHMPYVAVRADPMDDGEFWNTRGVLLITDRKLPAIAYIDDRAVHHTGDWTATLDAVAALDPTGGERRG